MRMIKNIKAWFKGRKAFGGLDTLAKSIGLVGIIVAISLLVVSKVQENISGDIIVNATTGETTPDKTAAYNALTTTIQAVDDIPGWLGTVIVIVIGALILSYMGLFSGGKGKK